MSKKKNTFVDQRTMVMNVFHSELFLKGRIILNNSNSNLHFVGFLAEKQSDGSLAFSNMLQLQQIASCRLVTSSSVVGLTARLYNE